MARFAKARAVDARLTGTAAPAGWASGMLFVCVVAAVTLAIRAHALSLAPFAASAAKIAAGDLWLLPASALVIDRPVYVGLAAFCLLAVATLRLCSTKDFWLAAAGGHIGSTLATYAIVEVSRLNDPDVFAAAVTRLDYGVSAIQAAWVGAIAATAWRCAGLNSRARTVVAAGVCAAAGVAWWLHPDPSILTTEHLFAFVIGCTVVSRAKLAAAARTIKGNLVAPPHPDLTITN